MRFRVSSELHYQIDGASTLLFALKCVETGGQHIESECFHLAPELWSEDFTVDAGLNRFTRIHPNFHGPQQVRYEADVATTIRLAREFDLAPDCPGTLTPNAVSYLFPSRYCQSDRLRSQSLELFGHLSTPYSLAAGICDWVFDQVAYVGGASNEQTSAMDTFETRQGVCRDFAHLAIALCRAMNVPARYVTCYSHLLEPPDFHAVVEVFVGDTWWVFDPTQLAPLNGLVRIATGRDAADTAVCTLFGNPCLNSIRVDCQSLDHEFIPITRDSLRRAGEALALL